MSVKNGMFKAFANKAPRLRGFTKKFYFSHPFLDAWFAWFPMNQMQYDGAAAGEIYNAASRIVEVEGAESWIKEWVAEGFRVKEMAKKLHMEGHRISASKTYLRAYTYFRTAHLATDPNFTDKEMRHSYGELYECYTRFRELSEIPMEKIKVPLKKNGKESGQHLHGYFLHGQGEGRLPTLIWLSGAESIAEDFYWWCGAEGRERGYNVFVVDNPGDTATRIYNEDVLIREAGDDSLISQMDYLHQRSEVDKENIFVYGISMGGYRAGRFAQIDNRMKAVVANAPMLDASKVLEDCKSPRVYKGMRDARGWGSRMCWQYGIDFKEDLKAGVEELVDVAWGNFKVKPEQIRVPFLVMAGENELGSEGIRQAHEFYDRLAAKDKSKRIITEEECGEAHCQLNNFPLARQIMFDWLEQKIS